MKSEVYFVKADRREGLNQIKKKVTSLFLEAGFERLIGKNDLVAIKIHFGEKGNKGYINPLYILPIIDGIKQVGGRPFLTDTNTLYKGARMNAVEHLNLAIGHGFNYSRVGAPLVIADGLTGSDCIELNIEGRHFDAIKIAKAGWEADAIVGIAHLTGHLLTGFGGAIKNMGMGFSSKAGKLAQHCDVAPQILKNKCTGCGRCLERCPVAAITEKEGKFSIQAQLCIGCGECLAICRASAIKLSWSEDTRNLQEKMAEYAYGILKGKNGKVGFMNFLFHITKDCDCLAKDDPSIVPDIGILASGDPVALDKASVDTVNKVAGKDKFRELYPEIDWTVQLRHAAWIGVGNLDYRLTEVK